MKKMFWVFLTLGALALAGCGGGGTSPAAVDTVSGVAAAGAVITGKVYLKDSAATPKELTKDTTDGSYLFDVTGMTKPFILKVVGTANGTNYTLYSLAGDKGTANINPMSNLVVANAAGAGKDLGTIYDTGTAAEKQAISGNLTQAVLDVQNSLKPLLQFYNADAVNPISDPYTADHTGLDGMLDAVKVDVVSGVITITNKSTDAMIFTSQVASVQDGVVVAASISFTTDMLSGKTFTEGVANTITFNANGTFTASDSTDAMTWSINSSGQLVVKSTTGSTTITVVSGNLTTGMKIYLAHSDGTTESITITLTVPSPTSFTTDMISGKTFIEGGVNTLVFNTNGTFTASDSTEAMTWSINSSGQIVVKSTTSSTTVTLVSGSLTTGCKVSLVDSDGTTASTTITLTVPSPTSFTTDMISGKTFIEGGVNTIVFNTNGTFTTTDSPDAKTWSINSSGQIVVQSTTGSTTVSVVSGNLTTGMKLSLAGSDGTTESTTIILKS